VRQDSVVEGVEMKKAAYWGGSFTEKNGKG
jgi:hypothetical protein